ncbi:Peptidase M14, carboxypeptidase A [uncultured Mycobacterium sp.]|uniref:Peptidase M14, carboxypeptidase A n=1 Tax=uncultured Mycobacterium sp. TaxID=171292 RepID=A0A1Y5PKL7_9MYCO|nr:Peptidase M14, carboxypeptidase A [uncultured Mycobacterium sp.]
MGYKKSAAITNAIIALESAFSFNCTRFTLNHLTAQDNQPVPFVKINTGVADAIPVLFTGGVHARELAPPDALLSFCRQLLSAFTNGTDITYPAFTDSSGVVYDEYAVPLSTVNDIFSRIDLYVVPCVNPDGRDFALSGSTSVERMWRKNRRPGSPCQGADINRNFPIAWDQDVYYSAAAATTVHTSKDPCSEVFRGYTLAPPPNGPAIEPETMNLMELVAQTGITHLVDVHMFGRTILYPWGIEQNQSFDQTQSFLNPLFNFQRDGVVSGTTYAEYIPDNLVDARGPLLSRHQSLAASMAAAIVASAGSGATAIQRSTYTPQPSCMLYPTTGAFDDFTFSRQFADPLLLNVHTFTLEAGQELGGNPSDPEDDDGGFWPDSANQYPKVEREIHAALFGLLSAI